MKSKLLLILLFFWSFYGSLKGQINSNYFEGRKSKLELLSPEKSVSLKIVNGNTENTSVNFTIEKNHKRYILKAQRLNGIKIYGATIKEVLDTKGNIIIIQDNSVFNPVSKSDIFPELKNILHSVGIDEEDVIRYEYYYFLIDEGTLIPTIRIRHKSGREILESMFDNEATLLLERTNKHNKDHENHNHNHNYASRENSNLNLVNGKALVFQPDPITSSGQIYGGDYAHNMGSTNSYLEAEQISVEIDVKFENGIYYLENNDVKIEDIEPPYWNIVTSTDGNFNFTRDQLGFQQVNAFYHSSMMKNEIKQYGFTDAVEYQIRIDADGSNGDDNSYFTGFKGDEEPNSYIEFGANDPSKSFQHVPDAEDAGVIAHEFTHAIVNSYSQDYDNTERLCLEEAIADYFSISYNSNYSLDRWQNIFKWDGHNEFWSGRSATSEKCYDDLSFTNQYSNTDLWVSAMMDIYFDLGKETTDKLMLHTISALSTNTSMHQAAKIFMKMDTVYYSSQNAMKIYKHFEKYCLLKQEDLNLNDEDLLEFKILNSMGFSNGEDVIIEFKVKTVGRIKIYDAIGRTIKSLKFNSNRVSINSSNLNSGVYIVNVEMLGKSEKFKLIKYQ
jgi:hypothetical protein